MPVVQTSLHTRPRISPWGNFVFEHEKGFTPETKVPQFKVKYNKQRMPLMENIITFPILTPELLSTLQQVEPVARVQTEGGITPGEAIEVPMNQTRGPPGQTIGRPPGTLRRQG